MSNEVTAEQKQKASQALLNELRQRSGCTFGWLWPIANEAMGFRMLDHHAPGYRFTDQWLQRGRKKGELSFERVPRKGAVWFLAEALENRKASLADANTKTHPTPQTAIGERQ